MGGAKGENALLAAYYWNSLELVTEHGIRTSVLPAISNSAYGFPLESARRIAVAENDAFLTQHDLIYKVVFVCHERRVYDCYVTVLGEWIR